MSGDPFPLVTVEVAFESSTNTPPTYTDVSADHVEAAESSYKVGRQYETDTIEPGTGTVQLNNDAGAYTGNRSSSPYYPYVKPQRRIRVRAIVPPGNLLSDATTFLATGAGWTATVNATAARVATPVMAGMSGSLAVTASAAGTVRATTTPRVAVVAGSTYTAAVWARAAASSRTLTAAVGWYNSAGTLLSTSTGTPVALVTTDSTQAKVTAVAPAGAVTANVVAIGATLAAAEKLYLGAPTLCPGVLAAADLATGRTSAFGGGWPGGVGLVSRTDVPFTDGFARLKRHTLGSAYREDVLLDNPFALYPLQELAGAASVTSISNTPQPAAPLVFSRNPYSAVLAPAAIAFGDAGLVDSDPGTSLKLTPEVGATSITGNAPFFQSGWLAAASSNGIGPFVNVNAPFTAEVVVALAPLPDSVYKPPSTYTPDQTVFEQVDADGAPRLRLTVYYDPALPGVGFSFQGAAGIATAPSVANYDSVPHHVVCRFDGTTASIWVDGVLAGSQSGRSYVDPIPPRQLIIGGSQFADYLNGSIAYVALYDYALPDARIRSHNAARLGFPGEKADARMGRILDYSRWPTADRALDLGVSALGPQQITGVDAVTALQATASDDGGTIFVDPGGRATFQNRNHRLNQSVKWTLDTRLQDVSADLSLQVDDGRVVNIVNVSTGRNDSTAARATDEASRLDIGDIATDLTLNLRDNDDLLAAANWTLALESQPQPRSSTLTVDPLTSAALWPFALFSTLGDVVELDNLPAQAPSSSMQFLIESKTWAYLRSGTEGRWTVSCEISPYLPAQQSVATFTAAAGDPLPAGITDPHTWDAFAGFDGSDVFAW